MKKKERRYPKHVLNGVIAKINRINEKRAEHRRNRINIYVLKFTFLVIVIGFLFCIFG